MRKPAAAWLVGLPLLGVSWFSAHGLAYRLVAPAADERAHLLAESGHGYLGYAPFFLAACATAALAGLLGRLARPGRGPTLHTLFALLPPIGFALQEQLERGLHGDAFWMVAWEPVFLLGLLLQLPLALAALLIAAALTGAADAVGLAEQPRARLTALPPAQPTQGAELSPLPVLAAGHAGRGPPVRL